MIANLLALLCGGGALLVIAALALASAGARVDSLRRHAKAVGQLRDNARRRERNR